LADVLNFQISQGSVATYFRWGGNLLRQVHREFHFESVGEKNWKWSTFAEAVTKNQVYHFFPEHSVRNIADSLPS